MSDWTNIKWKLLPMPAFLLILELHLAINILAKL